MEYLSQKLIKYVSKLIFAIPLSLFPMGLIHANWELTNGPKIAATQFLGTGANYVFASTKDSGKYRSSDDGNTWTRVGRGMSDSGLSSMVEMGTAIIAATFGDGIIRSTDSGATWTKANKGLLPVGTNQVPTVHCLLVSGETIFAGSYGGGIYKSSDSGASWKPANGGMTSVTVFSLAKNETHIFAASGDGVWRSSDNGDSWVVGKKGLFRSWVVSLAVSGINLVAGEQGNFGIYRSTDNGQTWTQTDGGSVTTQVSKFVVDGDLIFGTSNGNGMVLSQNKGVNWSSTYLALPSPYVLGLTIRGKTLFASTSLGGIYRRPLADFSTNLHPRERIRSEIHLEPGYVLRPGVQIRFETRGQGKVELCLFDGIGKHSVILLNSILGPGSHHVVFNGADLSNGVCFLRLSADGKVRTIEVIKGE